MSAWVFASVAGGSLGLLLGGALTQLLNWHWIFFVNIPIGLAVGMAGRVLIPNDRGIGFSEGIDWLGSLLVTVALAAAVYGFVEPPTYGWGSLHTLGPLAIALVLLTAFVGIENRHPNPIFPLRILKLHGLMLSCAARGLLVTGVYAMFFLGSLYLEKVLGYGALDTGLAFLPYTVTLAIMTLGVNRRWWPASGPSRSWPSASRWASWGCSCCGSPEPTPASCPSRSSPSCAWAWASATPSAR